MPPPDISTDIQRALARTEETNRNVEGTLEKVTSIHTNLTIIRERARELNRFDNSLLNEIRETSKLGCLVYERQNMGLMNLCFPVFLPDIHSCLICRFSLLTIKIKETCKWDGLVFY